MAPFICIFFLPSLYKLPTSKLICRYKSISCNSRSVPTPGSLMFVDKLVPRVRFRDGGGGGYFCSFEAYFLSGKLGLNS